ncbi:hypothetical protein BV898_01837 [Hypsibius exemplaris]|uniref:GATA-type domain-containing protein n=1 Tax=Hypsibius exemplaris TaxID=2072580 RepID=A0A1W0XA65_HYPEX|nr:hypothetical protein BV898_01837 [Hypsibius exemplaris]
MSTVVESNTTTTRSVILPTTTETCDELPPLPNGTLLSDDETPAAIITTTTTTTMDDGDVIMEDAKVAPSSPAIAKPILDLDVKLTPESAVKEEPSPHVNTELASDDVEMVDLSSENSVKKEEQVLEVVIMEEEVLPPVTDRDIKRLQSALLLEESQLILMKRMFQLQNAPPKSEKREETLGERERERESRKALLQGKTTNGSVTVHQNGVKGSAKGFMGGKGDKANLKDPKMQSIMKGGTISNNYPRSNVGPAMLELSKSLANKQSVNLAKAQQQQMGANHSAGGQAAGPRGGLPPQHARQQQPAPPQPSQAHPLERLEQQLSEEKANLKRQMEKVLLQIMPPKPPATDTNFIPATICPDFIALLGMELAASYAITQKNLVDQSPYPEPFVCLSCQENVCPAWKVDTETGGVVCESCFTASRTNAARLSHIENLKVAFADAIEKESELDRRHAATMAKARASHLAENIAPVVVPVYSPQKPVVQRNSNHHQSVNSNNNSYHHNNNNNTAHHVNRPASKQHQQQHHHQQQQPLYHHQQHHHNPHHSNSGMGHAQQHPPHHRSSLPPAPQSRHSGKPPISSPYAQQIGAPQPYAPPSSSSKVQHLAYHGGGGGGGSASSRQKESSDRQFLLEMISQGKTTHKQHQQQQSAGNSWRK